MKTMVGLHFIRHASWSEIFRQWRRQEAGQSGWLRHYRRKGYVSWAAWRTAQFAPLQPGQHRWRLFRVTDPLRTVPSWRAALFHGWRQKYYGRHRTRTFAQIAAQPKLWTDAKVRGIQRHWPRKNYVVGVVYHHTIYIIDGMHRACAIALSAREQKQVRGAVYVYLMRRRKPLGDLSTPLQKIPPRMVG